MDGRPDMMAPSDPADRAARRLLALAAGFVALVVAALVIWLWLSGPPLPSGINVAVEPPPKPAEPPAPADIAEQQTEPQPTRPLPGFNQGRALLPAPDPDLIEKSPNGFLPIIGRDGRQPWQVYARPFDLADKRPRIAIVISELGPSPTAIDAAINHLPAVVSLAFVPYRPRLGEWINLAREAGHEVLLDLPMEPADYPNNDPGPEALLTALDPPTNLDRLSWVLSQATGYVGLIGLMGSRFSTSHDDMLPILSALRQRGLLYIDNRSTPQTVVPDIAKDIGLAIASANEQLDTEPVRVAIDKKLSELEDLARRGGSTLGIAHPYPIVMERVAIWAQTLEERGIVLAPVSAVIDRAKAAAVKPAAPAAKPAK
jgi:polysaccharide deacetylase 2 family uncharacterized protein YibQ